MENDLISRQAAIDAPKRFTKDCNPEHFVGHSNFIEYMGTVGIRSFGNWQYANGFNMGLTAAEVAIKKLPPAQQERKKGKWLEKKVVPVYENGFPLQSCKCSECGRYDTRPYMYYFSEPNFCSYCSADMRKDDPSHPFTDDVMMKGEEDETD